MSLAPSSEDTALRTSLCDLHVIRVQFDFRPFDRMSWNRARPPENYWMHYFAKHTATWIAWYYSCTMQSSAGKHTEFATCVWGGVKLLLTPAADCKCSAFWMRCRKCARNVGFSHRFLVWLALKGSVQVSCSNIVLDDIGTSQSHYEMLTNLDLYSALTLNIPSYLKILT